VTAKGTVTGEPDLPSAAELILRTGEGGYVEVEEPASR